MHRVKTRMRLVFTSHVWSLFKLYTHSGKQPFCFLVKRETHSAVWQRTLRCLNRSRPSPTHLISMLWLGHKSLNTNPYKLNDNKLTRLFIQTRNKDTWLIISCDIVTLDSIWEDHEYKMIVFTEAISSKKNNFIINDIMTLHIIK